MLVSLPELKDRGAGLLLLPSDYQHQQRMSIRIIYVAPIENKSGARLDGAFFQFITADLSMLVWSVSLGRRFM